MLVVGFNINKAFILVLLVMVQCVEADKARHSNNITGSHNGDIGGHVLYSFTGRKYSVGLDDFPSAIPIIEKRKDLHSGLYVTRGRLEQLGGPFNDSKAKKVTFEKFQQILQCSPNEPGLDGARGSISLLDMLQPKKRTLKYICAWAQTGCFPWKSCHEHVVNYDENPMSVTKFEHVTGSPSQVRLIRIINSTLYYDWPWNREYFDKNFEHKQLAFYREILTKISDIKDSVFFKGEEQPFMPHFIPFPGFSESTTYRHLDILSPWRESISDEYAIYLNSISNRNHANENVYGAYNNPLDWDTRIPKAAFYGTITTPRTVVFDAAYLRPDLIDAHFAEYDDYVLNRAYQWNPDADEVPLATEEEVIKFIKDQQKMTSPKPAVGTYKAWYHNYIPKAVNVLKMKYKYLIVLVGYEGKAASGRLASYLAHSGAVILMQTHQHEYHFSARLRPWVHYVPITYSIADIVRKILWLRDHDHAAQRLAQNAKVFGESYLRLEDYYCYMGAALHTLGEIFQGSDAVEPFNPKLVNI